MHKFITEKSYDTAESFINAISYKGELYNLISNQYIFRGIASEKYELIPSALRKEKENDTWKLSGWNGPKFDQEYQQIEVEYSLLCKFFTKCDFNGLFIPEAERIRSTIINKMNIVSFLTQPNQKSWLPKDLLEIAALAQHYGIPTRLLDWSQDIFVSIYFATIGAIKNNNKDDYLVLWALNSETLDTFRYTDNMQDFPLRIILPRYYGNPNLEAQKGLFTFWQSSIPIMSYQPLCIDMKAKTNRVPLDKLITRYLEEHNEKARPYLYKIKIPTNAAKEIYKFLKTIKYDAAKLFPGYSGISKCIEEDSIALSNE